MNAARASIAGISYAFPETSRSLHQLAQAGELSSDPALLSSFGFERVHVAIAESPYDLAVRAASRLLAEHDVDPDSVDVVLYGGAPAATAYAPGGDGGPGHERRWHGMTRFEFPGARLQYDLGMTRATVIGLDQFACSTLFGAVRVARALCAAEGARRVLCVSADFFPADAGREAIFNCTSDAACALLIEGAGERNRILAGEQATKGYYWQCEEKRAEIVASYFPTARHVIERVIEHAGWRREDVDWVIPHNVSARSWDILLGLVRLPRARLWGANIGRHGHTLAGDNFINLRDAIDDGSVLPGQRLLLFSFGYGAHWSALAVEA